MNPPDVTDFSAMEGGGLFFKKHPWLQGNVGFFGGLLGWLAAVGAGLGSPSAMLVYASEMGSWCGTGLLAAEMMLQFNIVFLNGMAVAGWGLCRWTGLFRKSARWCIVLTLAFTVGAYGVIVLLPSMVREMMLRGWIS